MGRRALRQSQPSFSAPEEAARLRVGSTVAYCYRVIRELTPGGMSQLYLVEHLPSSSYAALKVAARPGCEVLAREHALLQRVKHPNVVRSFEHGWLAVSDRPQYLVLELIPGADLAAWLSAYGRLTPQHALSVLWQLSAAVDHLHAQGVVHSDIKPANIMLNVHDRRVTLIDFGVAFDLATEREQRGCSGTRGYTAPEQARGQGCSPASDRYAVAAVARELLGLSVAPIVARRVARPRGLEAVFRRALHPTPQARYASARNFVNALARALSAVSAQSAPSRPTPPSPSTEKHAPVVRAVSRQSTLGF
jgi:serine/threonine protein kinase